MRNVMARNTGGAISCVDILVVHINDPLATRS